MFKKNKTQPKSETTRKHLLNTALSLFRRKGLDATTMRDIAKQADVALGAAYYYFESKEAIVQAYYEQVQTEHARRVKDAFEKEPLDLLRRLCVVFHTKLEIVREDRKIFGALFRYTGEPLHPLSVFGHGTKANREQSLEIFRLALAGETIPEEFVPALPLALWALHLGALLYFIYDESSNQERTHNLVDSVMSQLVRLFGVMNLPVFSPFRGGLVALLREAKILPEEMPPSAV
jgi:AcrR family transcriptional regulator